MSECNHDPRFHLMGAVNGCCACHCEQQQADIERLRAENKSLDNARAAAELAGDALESQLFELAASERECRRLLREACDSIDAGTPFTLEWHKDAIVQAAQKRATGGGDERGASRVDGVGG